ncbi:serine/threonine-protein kinase [Paraliomyxa miuraensis]|uniref:serine/threonine-protein kinase n=1 Tax=Paraliomyxa miuraensis TaxID=376150 RepID=UPI002251D074|nr:serine/threonine-protein kinase [Paraliomyxa miuraensis]MCX4243963.1 serine/threonine protein kinase [Paraliomyxa miuraensis]
MTVIELEAAVTKLATAFSRSPQAEEAVRGWWRTPSPSPGTLDGALAKAANLLSRDLPPLSSTSEGIASLRPFFEGPAASVLLSWCSASAWRGNAHIAPMLELASEQPALRSRVAAAAGDRVVAGPLVDALRCAPLLGDGDELRRDEQAQVRARLEILVWEAGATAREIAELGSWMFGSRSTLETMVSRPAFGSLRGRVLAARSLEISVGGMPGGDPSGLLGPVLAALQPLLLHPEPLVWVHAARALGRLIGPAEQLEGMLLDWVNGETEVLRQRAVTALASIPSERLGFLAGQLRAIVSSPDEDAWVLAAVASATPYLFYERHDIWKRLADRILAGEGGPLTASALASGLAALWRRGDNEVEVARPLRALRDMARFPPSSRPEDLRGWIEVIAITDVLDGAERDPLDLERGLDNLVRIAAQYDDEEADARAARFAGALAPAIAETRRVALSSGSPRHRAAAMNALVACTRALALGLWAPLLATHPAGQGMEVPDLAEARELVVEMPAEILEVVREHRREGGAELHADVPLEVLALTLGGYALDAESDASDPTRRSGGSTAHRTCLWLRKLEGLSDGSRTFPPVLERALSEVFWRLVDATRGTARDIDDDDEEWLGPFAAWWALVIDRPVVLRRLANALPMVHDRALELCCEQADVLRTAVSSGATSKDWIVQADVALEKLHTGQTELAHGLVGLARAMRAFEGAVGRKPGLEPLCLELVLASDRLVRALGDPVKALRPAAPDGESPDSLTPGAATNAPRVASLVARAVSTREPSMVDVWLASLGPTVAALVETSIRGAIQRTPPPPPKKKQELRSIEGYELVKPLGEGGVGTVWLVRKPGADRLFVLKIPKLEALEAASDFEREGILASFVEEAAALASLYHPNVANIIDRGVSNGAPFLVLEYLIGADLKQYSTARKMSLFELRKVVLETCAGLAALHAAGLIHRDIKPANLWLRLPLAGGERFDPERHRDPAVTMPLSTVVIDFGMVRAAKVAPDVGGRFVAGTAGYIAPEQVLDPVELDPRADVYSLAGTIYNVTTGRAFFDDIEDHRSRIVAHMQRDPFEDDERLRMFPTEIARLLRGATAREPADRPYPVEFARAFAAAL